MTDTPPRRGQPRSTAPDTRADNVRPLPDAAAVPRPEEGWRDQALCAQTDPEAFFPEKGGSTRAAKELCDSCTVQPECLDYALANDERFGVWGGLSERERRCLTSQATSPAHADPDAAERQARRRYCSTQADEARRSSTT